MSGFRLAWALTLTVCTVQAQQYVISTVAGGKSAGYFGDGGPAVSARLYVPAGVAVDKEGNVYIADVYNNRVRKVGPNGVITTVAGDGNSGFSGDGGPATSARLSNPFGLAIDSIGSLYIVDRYNERVRRVSPTGTISTIAGNGTHGYSGDGGAAVNASLSYPTDIAVDSGGSVYISDGQNLRIRKIATTGIITTIAGNGVYGYSGDGGPATNAQMSYPGGLAIDRDGTLYFADSGNGCIRKISPLGTITTVAIDGVRLRNPRGVAFDSLGSLYVSDAFGYRIIRVRPGDNIATTIAGTGEFGYSGDGEVATNSKLAGPWGLTVDSSGNIYFSDQYNNSPGAPDAINSIRRLRPSAFILSGVTNAASNVSGPISPGEIVTIYGVGLGPVQLTSSRGGASGLIPCELAGTRVQVNGICAPLIYTSATQIAAVAPYALVNGTAQITVTFQGQTTTALSVPVVGAVPGVFTLDSTGRGQAACVNQDGSINTISTPAKAGDVLSCFGTGEGQTSPLGIDGKPSAAPLPTPNLPVTATIGGLVVNPLYAGGAPGLVAGVIQINVQIPSGITFAQASSVSFRINVGEASSQDGVTISVR